jgi:hypothetical protein
MPRTGRLALAIAGLVVAAVAAPLAAWMTFTPTGTRWSKVVDDTMTDVTGVFRVIQLGYAYLLMPALLVVLGAWLLFTFRRSPRRAAVFAGVVLLANLTVQFVKMGPLDVEQSTTSLDPLSGHVGVAAGVCLGWLVVAPTAWRRLSAAVAAAILIAVSAGVMFAGWHSPFQVFAPLVMGVGWAMVGASILGGPPWTDRPWRQQNETRRAIAATVAGLMVVAGSTAVLLRDTDSLLQIGAAPVALAVFWAAGWCAAGVGVVLLVSRHVAGSSAAGRAVQPGRPASEPAHRAS